MGRQGRWEEVGYAVLFLAADKASDITGTELVINGGSLAVKRLHRAHTGSRALRRLSQRVRPDA